MTDAENAEASAAADMAGLLSPEALRVWSVTRKLRQFSFDRLQEEAPAVLGELLPGARLRLQPESYAPVPQGRHDPAGSPATIRRCGLHFGPPEPLRVTVEADASLPAAAAILEYFHSELLALLRTAGYREELRRQARTDWLTGLPGLVALERRLIGGPEPGRLLGLAAVTATIGGTASESGPRDLRLRALARSLRLLLTEEEAAYSPGNGLLAVLIPEQQQERFRSFFAHEAPDARTAWAGSTEAQGLELLRLAEARLQRSEARPRAPAAVPEAPASGITVLSDSPIVNDLTDPGITDWHFPVPVTLVFDEPPGFALGTLTDAADGQQVVMTSCASHGYLLDLQDLKPAGLLVKPAGLAGLRATLDLIAAGERMYSGPLLSEPQLLERERHVWRLIAAGHDNEELAAQLGVQPKTAANYVSELLEKLGLPDRAALALRYWYQP